MQKLTKSQETTGFAMTLDTHSRALDLDALEETRLTNSFGLAILTPKTSFR